MSYNWDAINGHIGRPKLEKNKKRNCRITIRTNLQEERLLHALKLRTHMSTGEIVRQGLYHMAVAWKIDPELYMDFENK